MAAIVLFLSPHLDDAVFSAGALIAAQAPGAAVVATAFTATVRDPGAFALACQTDKGIPAEVDYMALRRAEDERACALLGAATEHLGFAEAPHRGYDSPEALFAELSPRDEVVDPLTARLRELIGERAPAAVCYPVGVGDHVDHRQLIAAVERLRPAFPGLRWVRWYDQPYTVRHRRDYPELSFARRVRGLAEVGEDVCAVHYAEPERAPDGPLARKVRAAASYTTQVPYQFYEALGLAVADEPDAPSRIARVLGRREWFVGI